MLKRGACTWLSLDRQSVISFGVNAKTSQALVGDPNANAEAGP